MFSSSFIHTFTQEEQNFVRWVTQITSLEKKETLINLELDRVADPHLFSI
jgi:hypothetical protein